MLREAAEIANVLASEWGSYETFDLDLHRSESSHFHRTSYGSASVAFTTTASIKNPAVSVVLSLFGTALQIRQNNASER